MKRVISSTLVSRGVVDASKDIQDLIGEEVDNDGKALPKLLKRYISPGSFGGGSNFRFHAKSKDGKNIEIFTHPTDEETQDKIVIDKIFCNEAIMSAEDGVSDTLEDSISALQDNFDYIISGIELLTRSGASTTQEAEVIVEKLGDTLQTYISEIGNLVQEA